MKNIGIVLVVVVAFAAGIMGGRMLGGSAQAAENSEVEYAAAVRWEKTDKGIKLTARESNTAMAYVVMPVVGDDEPRIRLENARVFSGGTSLIVEPDKKVVLGMISLLGYSCGEGCIPCRGPGSSLPGVPSGGVMGLPIGPGPRPCMSGTNCPCPPPPGDWFGKIFNAPLDPPEDPSVRPVQ